MKNYLASILRLSFFLSITIIAAQAQAPVSYINGTFTNNSVLEQAGPASQEVYGVAFDAGADQTTANGYLFSSDTNFNVTCGFTGGYPSFLSGGGTSRDTVFDAVLDRGRIGSGTGAVTLQNLVAGTVYQALFLLADTRSGQGAHTFSVASGSESSGTQTYSFVAGTPSLGGYVLATFVASGPTQTFTMSASNGLQLNALLVCSPGASVTYTHSTFTNNSVLALAGTTAQEAYGVNFDGSSTTTANGYAFDSSSSANATYDVTGNYSSFLSGGGTSGDSNFDSVLNTGHVGGSGTGNLTLKNLISGGIYHVLFLTADTRAGMGVRSFSVSSPDGTTSPSQVYAYAGGTPSLGGYVMASFIATGPTQAFTINNSYGYQLNGIMVCCVGGSTLFTNGAFTNNSVLTQAGSSAQEVYGVAFGNTAARYTANGYGFGTNSGVNMSYGSGSNSSSFLSGGGTSGDTAFNAVLGSAQTATSQGTLTLNNLTANSNYKVLFLLADTRSSSGGRSFSVSSGGTTSSTQTYAYPGGAPSLGGYVVGSFCATGSTQTFIINNASGLQLNSVLVCCTDADVSAIGSGTFTNNSVLSLAGFPMQEVYGVNMGSANAYTTANGYTLSAYNSNPNISYGVNGSWTGMMTGGATSGDPAFDSVLNTAALGSGTGILTLKNLSAGTIYTLLVMVTDTRSGMGSRSFSVNPGISNIAPQPYAFAGGTPALGGYVLCTFTATGMTQTFTISPSAYAYQVNAILLCTVGANTPFKSIEAETGTLGGRATVYSLPATLPSYPTPVMEASGRSFVQLANVGDSVTLTNNTSITSNTIVIRASIPDAPSGGGIDATLNMYVNGVFRQALNLTSRYSWVYSSDWLDDVPGPGKLPHRFFDEARTFITGAPIAPGSTITFQKDSANTAAYYNVDVMDLENVGPAKTQPANTLSITDYGATPNDTTDDEPAIQNCINAAQTQGKGVWIPAGVFYTNEMINATGISISGAGMWYSTFFRNMPVGTTTRSKLNLSDCNVSDLYIDGDATVRHGAADYGMTMVGTKGWVVNRVWVHNTAPSFWMSGINGLLENCRSGNSWADGVNLNNGPSADRAGVNLTAQNNFTRGTCDDGFAINSQGGTGVPGNMNNTRVINNTSVCAVGAMGMGVDGGNNSLMANNLICDATNLDGIVISLYGTTPYPDVNSVVSNNYILRCGSIGGTHNAGIHVQNTGDASMISVAVENNIIVDSLLAGIAVESSNCTFTGNVVENPGTQAIWIPSGQTGTATFQYNLVFDLNYGEPAFENDSPSTFSATLSGNNW